MGKAPTPIRPAEPEPDQEDDLEAILTEENTLIAEAQQNALVTHLQRRVVELRRQIIKLEKQLDEK